MTAIFIVLEIFTRERNKNTIFINFVKKKYLFLLKQYIALFIVVKFISTVCLVL